MMNAIAIASPDVVWGGDGVAVFYRPKTAEVTLNA